MSLMRSRNQPSVWFAFGPAILFLMPMLMLCSALHAPTAQAKGLASYRHVYKVRYAMNQNQTPRLDLIVFVNACNPAKDISVAWKPTRGHGVWVVSLKRPKPKPCVNHSSRWQKWKLVVDWNGFATDAPRAVIVENRITLTEQKSKSMALSKALKATKSSKDKVHRRRAARASSRVRSKSPNVVGFDVKGVRRACERPAHIREKTCAPVGGLQAAFSESCGAIGGEVRTCGCDRLLCSKKIASTEHLKAY